MKQVYFQKDFILQTMNVFIVLTAKDCDSIVTVRQYFMVHILHTFEA